MFWIALANNVDKMLRATVMLTTVLARISGNSLHDVGRTRVRHTQICPPNDAWAIRRNLTFFNVYSQSHQDGYLAYLFQNIGVTNKYYVEFGFNSPTFEGGSGANTYLLHKSFGWNGLLMDGGHANASINLQKEIITPANVVSLFDKYKVPLEPDFVSIDVDSIDILIAEAVLASKYSPRVINIEYNCNFPLNATLTVVPSQRWSNDRRYGASLGAIQAMANRHGYSIVHVVHGLDVVLVRSDVMCHQPVPPFPTWSADVDTPMHSRCANLDECIEGFMDSEVYFSTKNVPQAQTAARKYLEQHAYTLVR